MQCWHRVSSKSGLKNLEKEARFGGLFSFARRGNQLVFWGADSWCTWEIWGYVLFATYLKIVIIAYALDVIFSVLPAK